jgi:hypothetical protein
MNPEQRKRGDVNVELRSLSQDWLATIIGDRLRNARKHAARTVSFSHSTQYGYMLFEDDGEHWWLLAAEDVEGEWPDEELSPAYVWWRIMEAVRRGRVAGAKLRRVSDEE